MSALAVAFILFTLVHNPIRSNAVKSSRPIAAPAAAPAQTAPRCPTAVGQGATGGDVSELQRRLVSKGHHISQDGRFGESTTQAVLTFQRQTGLVATGRADEGTWRALGRCS